MQVRVPVGQVQVNQSITPTVMMVAPQAQNQTCTQAKKTQIVLGSLQISLGMMAIIFNVSILIPVNYFLPFNMTYHYATFRVYSSTMFRSWPSLWEQRQQWHGIWGGVSVRYFYFFLMFMWVKIKYHIFKKTCSIPVIQISIKLFTDTLKALGKF